MNQHFLNAQANLAEKIAQAYAEFGEEVKEINGQTPDPEATVEAEPEVEAEEKKAPKGPKKPSKGPKKGPKKPIKPEPEEEPEPEVEENEAEETEERSPVLETEDGEIDLTKMKVPALKKFAEEYGIEFSKAKLKKSEMIEEILDFLYEDAETEEAEEAEAEAEEEAEEVEEEKSATVITVLDEDEEEEEIELNDMKVPELKEFADEYGLEISSKKKSGIIKEIIEQVNGDEEDEEDPEEGETEEEESVEDEVEAMYGLDEMSNDELVETLEAYELPVKGKRQALVSRIVDAIEDGTIEVEEEEGE